MTDSTSPQAVSGRHTETLFVDTRVRGRVLLDVPPGGSRRLLVGFHGYGERADLQLGRLRAIPATEPWVLASVQALHPFYLGRSSDVGACWMTSADRERAIEDNLAYVAAVHAALLRQHAIDVVVHAGFSQGVAMAFRAALGAHRAAGVMALGGDVPPELRARPAGDWQGLRVLLARGRRDEYYSQEQMDADATFLRSRGIEPATFAFEGGHEWTPAFGAAVAGLLTAVAGAVP